MYVFTSPEMSHITFLIAGIILDLPPADAKPAADSAVPAYSQTSAPPRASTKLLEADLRNRR